MIKIIMGSISDYEVMKEAEELLKFFEVAFTIEIISAHRTPDKMYEFAKGLANDDIVIAGAGGAAHLPGMVAALCPNLVIGVPVKSSNLSGLDSLLSIVQMPRGIGVATVAINGSKNAALLAVQALAISDEKLYKKVQKFREEQTAKVSEMSL